MRTSMKTLRKFAAFAAALILGAASTFADSAPGDNQVAPDVWRRGNLSALYDVCECGDGMMGTLTSVRFSDSEVLLKREDTEIEK